jgi:serine/threonine-protein kinase RsbW
LHARTQFLAKLTTLHQMLGWIRQQLAHAGLDDASIHKVEVASEEALVNIIRHAYQNVPGSIDIAVQDGRSSIEITIRDQGPPFNPLERDISIDRSASIEERPIGGLGIFFMREYMDEVRYKREGDVNILSLIKKR